MDLWKLIFGSLPAIGKVLKEKEAAYKANSKILSSLPKLGSKIVKQQNTIRGKTSIGAVKNIKKAVKNNWGNLTKDFVKTPPLIKPISQLLKKSGICPNTCYSVDPVNLATGNFIYSVEDISTNGKYAISFNRFYNGIDKFVGLIGSNWHSSFDVYANIADNSCIEITFEDGHRSSFFYDDGCYVEPNNTTSVLIKNKDNTLTLRLPYGELNFNTEGKLISKQDIYHNKTNFEYEDGILKKVWNLSGFIYLAYNDNGNIAFVKDHTGRKVYYNYYCGNLTNVVDVDGNAHNYKYYENGLLKEIADPLNNTFITNFYDGAGRTVKQSFPDRSNMAYEYNDSNRTTILKERNGEKIVYYRDEDYQITEVRYFDGSEKFTYNKGNKLTKYIDKNNNIFQYEYTNSGQCNKETDPLGNSTQYGFNYDDLLIKKVTANGAVEEYEYDQEGSLMGIVNPLGVKESFTYSETGNPTSYIKDNVELIKIGYDERDNIISLTDGEANTTKYEYDSLNQVIKLTLPEGGETAFAYTPSGKNSIIINACSDKMEFTYDGAGNIISKKDFDGNITNYEYNKLNKLIRETDPLGNQCHYFYDEMWNVICETDKKGVDVFYEYDGLQRMVAKLDGEGNRTEYTYDPNGNIIKIKNPRGKFKTYEYDGLDQVVKYKNEEGYETNISYDKVGNIVKIVDFEGNEILYEYDLLNQITKVKDEAGAVTGYAYNPFGLVGQIENPDGGIFHMEYNHTGKLVKLTNQLDQTMELSYNKNGSIIMSKDYSGVETKYIYDNLERLTEVVDPFGNSKKYEYNKVSAITKITDENGNKTQYKYDSIGNLIQVTDAKGTPIGYTYDPNGNLITIDKYGVINKTCFEYDKRNLQISRIDPDGKRISYQYDEMENLISKTNRAGEETRAEYNASNLIEKITYPDDTSISYIYNRLGMLTEVKDWVGTMRIRPDPKGRPLYTRERDGKRTDFQYDRMGRATYIKYPDGYEVKYEYDWGGRLTKVIDGDHNTTGYSYNTGREIKEIAYPNNWKITYEYDSLARLQRQVNSDPLGTVIEDIKYTYDPVGNRIEQVKWEQSEYQDGFCRYTDKEGNELDDTGITKYIYDNCNQLTEVKRKENVVTSYKYDLYGNRTRMECKGKSEGHTIITYEHDNMDRLLKEEMSIDVDDQKKSKVTTYIYNPNGDLVSVAKDNQTAWKYYYNGGGQMVAAEDNQGNHGVFHYDGIGRRIKTIEYSEANQMPQETNYILDYRKKFDNVIMTYGTNSPSRRYIRGISLISVIEPETNRTGYYLNDVLGSPTRLVDDKGLTESAYRYDEYGTCYKTNIGRHKNGFTNLYGQYHNGEEPPEGEIYNPFGFTGYQHQNHMELYFAQQRYYNSHLGRFVQKDSMEYIDIKNVVSFNLYTYCENNPVYFVDPLGLMTHEGKNIEANKYVKDFKKVGDLATEELVLDVMVSGNSNDDAHTLAEILVYKQLVTVGFEEKFTDMEVTIQVQNGLNANTNNYIDILATTEGGIGYIYEIKSKNNITNKGSNVLNAAHVAAVEQVKRYRTALNCTINKEVREKHGIKILGEQKNTPGMTFEVLLFKNKNYDVRMKLEYRGNGIYTYEINTYKGDKEDDTALSQVALRNMVDQHRKEKEAKKIVNEAVAVTYRTVAVATVANVIAALVAVLASASAMVSVPALSGYVASNVPGFVAGVSATVVKYQPQIEKVLKPIAKEVVEILKKVS